MDTVVAKLKTRESKLTENIDILQKSEAHEGHLVTVQVVILLSGLFYCFLPTTLCQKNRNFAVQSIFYCRIFWVPCRVFRRCLTVQGLRESVR